MEKLTRDDCIYANGFNDCGITKLENTKYLPQIIFYGCKRLYNKYVYF